MNKQQQTSQSPSSTDSRALSPRQQGQRMTLEERRAAQDVFLKAFALNCNVTASCIKARIDHSMISYWEKNDPAFAKLYIVAKAKARDMVRAAWWQRSIEGVKKPLTCAKGLIYEEVDGKNGKETRPVTVMEYSDSLLALMIRCHLPEAAVLNSGGFTQQATVATNDDGQAVVQIKTQWGSAPALERGGHGEE